MKGLAGRRRWFAAFLAVLLLGCTGCSMDVDSFLKPPLAQGEQQQIQTALETYIRDSGFSAVRYTLHYPSEGEYTSAFVVCGADGRPVQENGGTATQAVAFYSLPSAPEETHINLLYRDAEEWVSVSDLTGFGSDILQVAFGDLDGDGVAELLTGWNTYNSRDHRLVVLSAAGETLRVLSDDRLYTQLYAGDLTANERDDLLLLRSGSANTASAELLTLEENEFRSLGKAPLDGYIQQFGSMQLCKLSRAYRGLYVDAVKSGGVMITELLYYDGGQLCAPFYDPETNSNTATARRSGLAARDINGDGLVEIPAGTLLPGYEEGTEQSLPSYAWLTVWRAWDVVAGAWRESLYTVINTADGYAVALEKTQYADLTTEYNSVTNTLSLCRGSARTPWLRLCVAAQMEDPGYFLVYEGHGGQPGCFAWIDDVYLDKQKVQYMVTHLEQ